MNLIQKEIMKFTGLNEEEVVGFMSVLKNKGFLEPDNSMQILLQILETSYTQGKADLLKELSIFLKEDENKNK